MKKTFFSIILLLSSIPVSAFSCSIFFTESSDNYYFASNEDWTFTDPAILFVPGNEKSYGYAVFGWKSYLPAFPQGGVNEYGVCLDWASVPPQSFVADKSKKETDGDITLKILSGCRNLDDVFRLINDFNFPQFSGEHLLVSDASGNSAVIEWNNGKMEIIRKKGKYQAITNFPLSDPSRGWYPCSRFDAITNDMNGKKEYSLELVCNILEKTHQEGQYPTVYSYIVDVKKILIHVYQRHRYDQEILFDFKNEIKKGKHSVDLF